MKKSTAKQGYLTALGAFALAYGCSVGWGSFVMPGTTFLPIAGPLGTTLGIGAGMLVMLIIAVNYDYLIRLFPGCGGAYTYAKKNFGYDHGFISAWFLLLTYVAIIWANATALPLVVRAFFGGVLQFGFHYNVAGFDVYFGELLLIFAALSCGALFCLKKTLAMRVQTVMAFVLFFGVAVCFGAAVAKTGGNTSTFEPLFAPSRTPLSGTLTIFALAPWAFVGFESISHSAGEARFPLKRSLRIMVAALIAAALTYAALAALAVTALPEGATPWTTYISRLDAYTGLASMPTFFAARQALGTYGQIILGAAAVSAMMTGIIGNYIALSRLMHAMSEDGILFYKIGRNNKNDVPARAILAILAFSAIPPFFGRAAIGWIVDVTTVGATVAFAFTCAAALRSARREKNGKMIVFGVAGLLVSLLFALEFLVPNVLSIQTLSTESYLILAAWGLLGFLVFNRIIRHDKQRLLGRSTVAWIILLGLIIFCSSVWMRQAMSASIDQSISRIGTQYVKDLTEHGVRWDSDMIRHLNRNVQTTLSALENRLLVATIVQVAVIAVAVLILFIIYAKIQKRERKIEIEKAIAEENSRAKTTFLSNMSHEIRTPMNAIIGLDNIALRDPDVTPKTRDCLEKIGRSAHHLLDLINDILDMSRIESGRMVVKNEEFLLADVLEQVNIIINGQCMDKGLDYTCTVGDGLCDYYFGDDIKLRQVLINILGNAVKFTPSPGNVYLDVGSVTDGEGVPAVRFVMRDTGIGMDKAFIPKLFESFSQEDATTTNKYGGSGLGMAITKNLVEMMNGGIAVESEKGVGSTFTVTLRLQGSGRKRPTAGAEAASAAPLGSTLAGRRVLMAEDVDANAEILADLLDLEDVTAERAENGRIAVETFAAKPVGYYDAILMDVRMPEMDGLEATVKIRALDRADAATVPIIAMTANVFDEDVRRSREAGMNAHLAKPIDAALLYATLARLIADRDGQK